jgi:hypothetical protein
MKLSKVGPNIIPAMISPIIAGCFMRSNISPKKRARTNSNNNAAKNGNSNFGSSIISNGFRYKVVGSYFRTHLKRKILGFPFFLLLHQSLNESHACLALSKFHLEKANP